MGTHEILPPFLLQENTLIEDKEGTGQAQLYIMILFYFFLFQLFL